MQGTMEWRIARSGKVTASRIADVIAKTKSGYSASRTNYMTELVIERFGVLNESFVNEAMQWGTETEPLARIEYEKRNFTTVDQIDFVPHPTIEMTGASPDGLIGTDGILEIKCCNTSTHFKYLIDGEFPIKYKPQVMWILACTKRKWADFVSYDPRAPKGLEYFSIRVDRDDEYIDFLEKEVISFLNETEIQFNLLKQKLL